MHLHIGRNQDNTHPNRKQAVPHEVTCNPTDDTACDDELSNSFGKPFQKEIMSDILYKLKSYEEVCKDKDG